MVQRSTKHVGKDNKGKPSTDRDKDKASVKDLKETKEERERDEELRDEYTDGQGNPDPDKVPVNNPNRNTNKPDIDKPDYGGGTK